MVKLTKVRTPTARFIIAVKSTKVKRFFEKATQQRQKRCRPPNATATVRHTAHRASTVSMKISYRKRPRKRAYLDSQINAAVYKLYGLTAEEIEFIDEPKETVEEEQARKKAAIQAMFDWADRVHCKSTESWTREELHERGFGR